MFWGLLRSRSEKDMAVLKYLARVDESHTDAIALECRLSRAHLYYRLERLEAIDLVAGRWTWGQPPYLGMRIKLFTLTEAGRAFVENRRVVSR